MRTLLRTLIAPATFCVSAASAHATAVALDFQAFALGGGPHIGEKVGTYFDGGFGSFGTGPDPNLGLTFEIVDNFQIASRAGAASPSAG